MKKADAGDVQRQIAEGFQAAAARLAGRDISNAIIEAGNAAHRDDEADVLPGSSARLGPDGSGQSKSIKAKRSTERGEGQARLMGALTKHHKYADGSCLKYTPIGNNELARSADVSQSTASSFFNKWFGSDADARDGYSNYKIACHHEHKLRIALKTINGELRPGESLFGHQPPDEAENPDHRGDRRRKPRASDLHSVDGD